MKWKEKGIKCLLLCEVLERSSQEVAHVLTSRFYNYTEESEVYYKDA